MRKELVILVDCLEEASIDHMQNSALLSFGCLAALHSLPPHDAGLFNVGLCAIHKQPNGRDVQLKVLLRPGPFSPREFHFAVQKLHASASPGTPEPLKTGLALKSLVAHLAGRKGLPAPLQTTVCLLGCAFGIDAFRRPIAEAARACMRLHFVALVPEFDAGGPAMSDAERTTFLADIADADNATASFIPNDPASLQQLALQWLRDFALPPPRRIVLALPTSLLHCGLLSQVLPLAGGVAADQQCACHRAALVALGPGAAAGVCSVSGAVLQQRDIVPDPHIVRLGAGARLAFPRGTAVPPLRMPQEAHGAGGSVGGSAAKVAAADGVVLQCVRQVKVEELSEGLMWGRPHLLAADGEALSDFEAGEANEDAMAALCQVLREAGSGLLLSAAADLDAAEPDAAAPFVYFYAARPAADCATLLVRRIASAEELLPVVGALPPPAKPSREALQSARAQLAELPLPASGGLWSPLDHSCGAFEVVRPLLQASLPAAPVQPAPAPPAVQQPAPNAGRVPVQPPAAGQQRQQQQHGGGGGAEGADSSIANQAEARNRAAQLGGRMQRLRLPNEAGRAADANPAVRQPGGGDAGAVPVPQSDRRSPGAPRHARQPLPARQPAGGHGSSESAQRRSGPSLGAAADGGVEEPSANGGGQEWPGAAQPRGFGGVTRFCVAPPAARGGKGRQRGSGGPARGGLPLKRLRKAS